MINQIRVALVRADSDVNTSVAARLVLNRMITKFNEEFGTGFAGTVFTDHENGGPSRRLRGFQLKTMIATALDPRTKTLVGNTLECNYQNHSKASFMIKFISITGIPSTSNDREHVWTAIKDLMIELWVAKHNARVWSPELLNGAVDNS